MELKDITTRHHVPTEYTSELFKNKAVIRSEQEVKGFDMVYIPIKESIHLDFLNGNIAAYEKMIEKDQEKSIESFKDLIKNFDSRMLKLNEHKITIQRSTGLVIDGNHRIAILIWLRLIEEELPEKFIKYV